MSLIRTLLRSGFQAGQVPKGPRRALEEEGLLLLEEGLPGTICYFEYSRVGRPGPATYTTTGAIAVTKQRFMVWAGREENIDIAFNHPVRKTVTVTLDEPGQVCFAYSADAYSPGRTGAVEVRLHTGKAAQIDVMLNPAT